MPDTPELSKSVRTSTKQPLHETCAMHIRQTLVDGTDDLFKLTDLAGIHVLSRRVDRVSGKLRKEAACFIAREAHLIHYKAYDSQVQQAIVRSNNKALWT